MRTEFRVAPHMVTPGVEVVEVWFNGELVGEVVGMDGMAGVSLLTKFPFVAATHDGFHLIPNMVSVKIGVER